jgi:MSHA biogenesis protein MshQ
VEGGFKVVSGRIRLSSVHGSELLAIPIQATVQYWDGSKYVVSTTDSTTSFVAPTNLVLGNYQQNLTSVSVVGSPFTVTFSSGACNAMTGCFQLAAPGAGHNGSVDIGVNSPAYLPSNTVRATFGVYKNANEFIYLRENY